MSNLNQQILAFVLLCSQILIHVIDNLQEKEERKEIKLNRLEYVSHGKR